MPALPTGAEMARIHAAAFTGARPWSVSEFRELLDSPGVFAVGDSTAFALVRVAADEAELLTIATLPQAQRRGMARALMAGWTAEAGRRGARHAYLEVAADNSAARALYLACGFREAGRRRDYYTRTAGAACDAIIMALPLTPGQPGKSGGSGKTG